MQRFLIAFCASLVAATLFTPLAKALAIRLGAVSNPGGRHINAQGIPRLGGLALAAGWTAPLAAWLLFHPLGKAALQGNERQLIGAMGGGLSLCLLGALDDLRGVRAVHKLFVQAVVACLAYALGFRIEAVALPLIGTLPMGVFAVPVTVLWIVGITNAVNLIDGLDGLAAGVTFFAAFTGFIVSYLSGSTFVALMMASLMGAVVGFLFFNFNPARIFMGDSGSYFLGFVLATTSLAGSVQQKASTAVALLVPVIALGLPIFDTLFSMFRRFLERRPIFSPDRGHVHHRLLELGLTHRRAVILLYLVSIVLAGGAIAVSLGRSWEVGAALLFVSAVFVALVRFLGYFQLLHVRRRQHARFYDEPTNRLRHVVPTVLRDLAAASSEGEVLAVLQRIPAGCGLSSVALQGDGAAPWRAEQLSGEAPRSIVKLSFPLGRDAGARTNLNFEWSSDFEDAPPEAAILLQLVADQVTASLRRASSPLVAEPLLETIPEVTASQVPVVTTP